MKTFCQQTSSDMCHVISGLVISVVLSVRQHTPLPPSSFPAAEDEWSRVVCFRHFAPTSLSLANLTLLKNYHLTFSESFFVAWLHFL